MGRRATKFWHAALSLAAGVLYFCFVLPRWWELMGDTSHSLGTVARIAAGLLIGLAGLPVVLSLVQLRKPEFGTPALALNLRTASVVAHVTAGVLIVGTAISEIWLSLDSVGQWLFGIYGAAAAIALLGIAAFYLSFVAEQAPPPPKPLKPKSERRERRERRRRGKQDDEADAEADDATDEADDETEASEDDEADASDDDAAEMTATEATTGDVESTAEEAPTIEAAEASDDTDDTAEAEAEESGGLRNRRPSGKVSHRRRRSRRDVAVDE
ncbi:hypothetical protein PT015_16415 [Candidatus Mycobacterium wuenschmannii]|uniref:Transmembrane protein n=1 Tax=Candidatus Mycobacterium wuenschmannii TaxID=3027808 RepID=A0ABY8VUK0_9MYCO|nr:hypothetical protein [Candidatus Mycobacterium wuenschmannii]WIM86474.1 hypothetical protein PT015_16415 [Candidatus Mycobacterium wuenschmannii]